MLTVDWTSSRSIEETKVFMLSVSTVLADLGGPLSKSMHQHVLDGEWLALVNRKIDYTEELSVADLRCARSIQALVAKQDFLDLGIDVRQAALDAFMKAEQRCLETNKRLESGRPRGRVSIVSHYASRKISEILGRVPSLSELPFAYGPGASTNVKGVEASPYAKLNASPVCSEDMLPHVGEFLAEFPYLAEHHGIKSTSLFPLFWEDDVVKSQVPVQVGLGKLTFVPKNAKTMRPIVIEPVLNGLAQKGIGTFIKDRLLRLANLNLRDQQRNREAAFRGSIDGSLATIDLASASDTLSLGCVAELLPFEWFDFLGRYRTGEVLTDSGESIELEKFSSMGNGYTFELESLIFYGLAYGCCRALDLDLGEISVFGDDIIVPTAAYELLKEVLEWFGFEVNASKSYHDGPFRESCGADWFRGCDVRPFYLRKLISDQVLYAFHNWAMRNGERLLATIIHEWTWEPLRLYGPDGYGDGHLLGGFRLRTSRVLKRRGYCGGFFDTYSSRPKRLKKRRPGDWLYPGYSVYTRSGAEGPSDPFIVRGSSGYVKSSIYTLATGIFIR